MPDRAHDDTHRILHLFGDVLPDSTADDRCEHEMIPPDQVDGLDQRERWLRENRPPHHDGPYEGYQLP